MNCPLRQPAFACSISIICKKKFWLLIHFKNKLKLAKGVLGEEMEPKIAPIMGYQRDKRMMLLCFRFIYQYVIIVNFCYFNFSSRGWLRHGYPLAGMVSNDLQEWQGLGVGMG